MGVMLCTVQAGQKMPSKGTELEKKRNKTKKQRHRFACALLASPKA
jgi:hypothetical protein